MSFLPDNYYTSQKKPAQSATTAPVSPWTNTQEVSVAPNQPGKWDKWGNSLRWAGKQLMKPVGAVASVTEGVGTAIGRGEIAPLGQGLKKAGEVLQGKQEESFANLWRQNLPEHQIAGTIIGTVIDIAADPLNFVGGAGKKVITGSKTLLSKVAGKSETVARIKRGLETAFSTSSGVKEFDTIVDKYKSLGEFRKAQIMENARALQQTVKALPEGEMIKVANYIEKGTKSSPEIMALGDKLKATYSEFKTIEKSLGIKGGEIENYVPRYSIQDTLKQKIKKFFNAPEWSANLGSAAKHRNDWKFVSKDGEELFGTAEYLGLKKTTEGYINKAGKLFQGSDMAMSDIHALLNRKIFEENPAIQYAQRGLAHVKAVTSQEFFNATKQFAKAEGGVETGVKALEGLKFDERVSKQIGEYYKSIQPEELRLIVRTFDNVQNWWKGQVLIAPSYHVRNMVGNVWNNFLAGVIDPTSYKAAGQLQMGLGKDMKIAGMSGEEIVKLAKERGVINAGWYGADIPSQMEKGITSTWKQGFNPLSQENYAFKANKAVGSAFENNARLAHFIDKLKRGESVDNAVMSVKKYLFDYNDLTNFEKTVMKRALPFYTWTRKNIPLQLEHLITQPGKYSGMEKVVRAVESIGLNNADPANEKYLSEYIKNNTAMRVRYDENTGTYYYFLLGNWLPSYQAIDFLSEPFYNIAAMLNPFVKGIIDLKSNKSQFFQNTLGESEVIEKYPGDTTNFLGFNMPKKTAYVLRNIRLLNELDKLNPGGIFGGSAGEQSAAAKVNLPAFSLPGAGTFTPAQQKYGEFTTKPSNWAKFLNLFTGKLQAYKEELGQSYYNSDTKSRIDDYQKEIRGAYLKNDIQRAQKIYKDLQNFIEERTKENKPSSFNFGAKEAKASELPYPSLQGGGSAIPKVQSQRGFVGPIKPNERKVSDINSQTIKLSKVNNSAFSKPVSDSVPNRNNNPLNLVYVGDWQKDFGVSKDGRWASFPTVEQGVMAAKRLLISKYYKDLSVDKAMFKWTGSGLEGKGYNAADVGFNKNTKIKDLTEVQLHSLILEMAKREGFKQLDNLAKYLNI